jgi:arsenate reductase
MDKTRVLFLCTGNSVRSQMAEAFLRKYAGDRFEVYSAGLEPSIINPLTIRVMEEMGIDLSNQRSKSLQEYMGKLHFGYLITVCDRAEQKCPIFPGMGMRLHWPFEDPSRASGNDAERLAKFRQVRDQIDTKVREWLNSMP